jgi:S1-C subfamily serine protease
VVENSETIEVRLRDGRSFPAKIRGSDPASDLAVIKIEAQDLSVAKFGNSDKLKVGELVIAVGSPYGLDYTTTFGHISATGRTYVLPGYTGAMMDQEFIQTDALISPGNSGGPLASIEGEIIGINTLIQSQRAGIGFALPGNMAREIADHLVATGKYPRTWLGLDLRDLRPGDPLAEKGGDLAAGAVVSKIHPDSPAARSKLQALDIIQAIDGKPMKTSLEVRRAVRSARVGQVLVLDIVRASAWLKLEVRAAAFDANEVMKK